MMKRSESQRRPVKTVLLVVFELLLLLVAAIVGGGLGYRDGFAVADQFNAAVASKLEAVSLREQYELAVRDFEAGRYDLARQRFEYVLTQAPDEFPDALAYLEKSLAVLNATATFTPEPPTSTPSPTATLTPTYDPSGEESVYQRALALLKVDDWDGAIDAVLVLRNMDLHYRVTEVDDILYAALRNRGENKILMQGDLEGGIYDLTLAEKFGPLDYQAAVYRYWARVYLAGLGFWQAYPQQAVYYFGQVANAAPGLKDGGGWSARERYRASLIHYGDALKAEGLWCEAEVQYELALEIRPDPALIETMAEVENICSPPTETPIDTATITNTLTISGTPSPGPSSTPTVTPQHTPTPSVTTNTQTPTSTSTATNTLVSTPAHTPTVLPSATDAVLPTATRTNTPAASPTATSTATPIPTATDTAEAYP